MATEITVTIKLKGERENNQQTHDDIFRLVSTEMNKMVHLKGVFSVRTDLTTLRTYSSSTNFPKKELK